MNYEATIEQYADFYSEWFGLKDGTMLDLGDERGRIWRKVGNGEVEDITDERW